MGRYYSDPKITIEECKDISTSFLRMQKYFQSPVSAGEIRWTRNGEPSGRIGIIVNRDEQYVQFRYSTQDRDTNVWHPKEYTVRLLTTPCNLGGDRYWFECFFCQRRVGKLYLYGRNDFACRHCHNLSYDSRNGYKEFRGYQKYFDLYKVHKKILDLKVKFYRGKPTRRHAQLLKKRSFLMQGSVECPF